MREAAGTSTKSSLFHTWTRDSRDHAVYGTGGVRAQFRHELAGLGGDTAFYKAEGGLQASRVLLPGVVSTKPTNVPLSPLTSTFAAPLTRRTRRGPTPAQQYVCADALRLLPAGRTDEPADVPREQSRAARW